MKVELDRKGIISLLRGVEPPYSVMDKIPKELGYYIGGFVDKWNWSYIDENTPYSDEYLFNLYLMCRNSELDEDNEEFSDYEPEYIEINKEDISIGDYIGIECERFAEPCHLRIVDIQQRYNEMTGEPYKIVIDEENEIWSTRSGMCLSNPKTFYEIYGYFRELK